MARERRPIPADARPLAIVADLAELTEDTPTAATWDHPTVALALAVTDLARRVTALEDKAKAATPVAAPAPASPKK